MRRLKLACTAMLVLLLLGGAGYWSLCWLNEGNAPLSLWATDDTRWSEAVPASSPDSDRDHPVGIKVEVEKLYGIRLGQPVKVRITTRSRNSVKISIDTLLAGKLQRDPSPWRLYSKPQMISEEKVNGFTTRVFVVTVAVWEPPTTPENLPGNAETPDAAGSACVAAVQKGAPSPVSMLWPFTMEFLISSENMANGLPKWQYMQVPCVNFGFSSTLEPLAREHGFEFGPLGFVPPHPLMAGVVMSWAGIAIGGLGCLYLIYLLGSWVRRQQVPLEMPANAKAYHRLMAEAQHIRDSFSPEELEYFAFRDYLGDPTTPDEELLEKWRGHPDHERVSETFATLRRARLHRSRVSDFERARAREFMQSFIPQKAPLTPTLWQKLKRSLRWVRPSYLFSWDPPHMKGTDDGRG